VATILELAAYADVSAENVLRVVHGEPVSDDVERRVHEAIDALGAPPYPRQVEVLPAIAPGNGTGELLERVRLTSAELEAALPEELGSAVSEAFRLEVCPVEQQVAELGALLSGSSSASRGSPRASRTSAATAPRTSRSSSSS